MYSQTRILSIIFFALALSITAQDNIKLVTYGPKASRQEGDPDFRQIVFFQVPSEFSDSFYIRIYDPETYGKNDISYRDWNTKIKYSLYGGSGVFSGYKAGNSSLSGDLLGDTLFAAEAENDDKWATIFKASAYQGESYEGFSYLALLIEGLDGDDANGFDVFVSKVPDENIHAENVRIFTYDATLRLELKDQFASLKFVIPEDANELYLADFDLSNASLSVNTAFRDIRIDDVSGGGDWRKRLIKIDPLEKGMPAEIAFGQGGENPNDASFFLTDTSGNPIAIELPVKRGKLNKRPFINKSFQTLADCNSVVFDAEGTYDPDGMITEYYWNFGDGSVAKGSRVVHRYESQDSYEVTLIVKDNSDQVGNSQKESFTLKMNISPSAKTELSKITAPGDIINFDASASSDPDGAITEYLWSFGDGSTAKAQRVQHSYAQPGRYRAMLRVKDNSDGPCNTGDAHTDVWVNAPPVAVSKTEYFVTSTEEFLELDGSASYDRDGKIASYYWDLGDGTSKDGQIIRHKFESPGIYTVLLTVSDDANVSNSKSTTQLKVKVNIPPLASAGDDKVIAHGETTVFEGKNSRDNDGYLTRFEWDFGDGMRSTGSSVVHQFANPGVYKVKLKVFDDSGTLTGVAEDELIVTVNARPIAKAGENVITTESLVKFDGSRSLDSDGQIVTYDWDFGDGSTGTGAITEHIYRNTGTYTVSLKVTDNTGTLNNSSLDAIQVVINKKPIADAGPDVISIPGENIVFDGSRSFDSDGEVTKYDWNFGDGSLLSGKKVQHIYQNPGKYSVTLKVTDNTGQESAIDFDEAIVIINNAPVAIAGDDRILAPGASVTFDASGSYDSDGSITAYNWEFSDGYPGSNQPAVTRAFEKPGIYYAVLRVRDNSITLNSLQSDTVRIFVNSSPIVKLQDNIRSCSNYQVFNADQSIDPDGDPLKYIWDMGDGSDPKTGIEVAHLYAEGGSYPVTLKVDDGRMLSNSVSSVTITLFINKPPVAEAGEDRIICSGDVVIFNAGASTDPEGGPLKFVWDFGDGTTGEGVNPVKTYKNGGTYTVGLTVQDDSNLPCNMDFDVMVITVVESPVAKAGRDTIVCANNEVVFDGRASRDYDGVVNSFTWDFGDGGTGGGPTPTYIFNKAGTYKVQLTITGDKTEGCDNTDTDEITVKVIEAPIAEFNSRSSDPVNVPVDFDASLSSGEGSNIVSYEWDMGDGTTLSGKNSSHVFSKEGNYLVTLKIVTDSETECNSSIVTKRIVINAAPYASVSGPAKTGENINTSFSALDSFDPDGAVIDYLWDFGDGHTMNGLNAVHKYNESGKYKVILTVTDNSGLENNTAKDTLSIFVNASPSANIKMPISAGIGEEIELDGSGSADADGKISKYLWVLDNGEKLSGQKVKHRFDTPGIHEIRLNVTDNSDVQNSEGSVVEKIKINSAPQILVARTIYSCPGDEVSFQIKKAFDPDGDSLSFEWIPETGVSLRGREVNYIFNSSGKYRVKVVADDGSGSRSSSCTEYLEVLVNHPPVAAFNSEDKYYSGGANDEIVFTAFESTDADGDPLSYLWDFGDGNMKSGMIVKHSYSSPGSFNVRLQVSDNKPGSCASSTIEKKIEIIKR